MSSYFQGVIKVIKSLINKWGEKINKFAVVGYTDHGSDSGLFNPNRPVTTFPSSKNLEDAKGSDAIIFINGLRTSGGGGNYGEALIDGLDEANTLTYRKDSNRIYVLVCDEPPHGKEFSEKSTWPDGCPCGINWRSTLTNMKNSNTGFIFIRLGHALNLTKNKFEEIYGESLTIMDLKDASNFKLKVTNLISQIIEKNYEYCDKSRILPP